MIERCTEEDLHNLCDLLEYKPHTDMKGIKLTVDGEVTSMVGYDGWTHNSVVMHVWVRYGKMPTKEFIREAFRYPFEIGNKGLVLGLIPGYNAPSLKFAKALGFREAYRIRDGWSAGTDLVIQEMRREHCRWLDQKVPDGKVDS